MPLPPLTAEHTNLIKEVVSVYEHQESQFRLFRDQLLPALINSARLTKLVHSMKSRIKDPRHLRDKLRRKARIAQSEGRTLALTRENFGEKVTDLVGVRILHLYTRQIKDIDVALREVFDESKFELLEGPFARTWDDESREFFTGCGIETQSSPSMYTSVHYVIGSSSRTKMTAEIQVRTLMEEVWGEVDHLLNYPRDSPSLACREQLKVLARVTSSATRLVDSIFLTAADHTRQRAARVQRRPKTKG